MSLLTFARTALGSLVKEPVTVCYPAVEQERPERLRGHVVNDIDVCILCGMCGKRCPAGAIEVDRKGGTWSIDPYNCVACGECVECCPKKCLSMSTQKSAVAKQKLATVQTKPVQEKPAATDKPKPKVQLTPEQLERVAKAKAAKAAKEAAKKAEAEQAE